MAEDEAAKEVGDVLKWILDNRDWLKQFVPGLRKWLFRRKDQSETAESSILVIGPGGVGKSTAAQMLSGKFDSMFAIPGAYEESLALECYNLKDDENVELIVPPGQSHRRDATWNDVEVSLASGEYRGVILIGSFGYHALGKFSYKHHRLYKGDDRKFMADFLASCRREEVRIVERLAPFLKANRKKSWLLNLVTKQDLWWPRHAEAEAFYKSGAYGREIKKVREALAGGSFRQEFVFGSLVIGNFTTGAGEQLAKTAAGYDQQMQIKSVMQLWKTLEALKEWEEST